jgi:hypothetical protein
MLRVLLYALLAWFLYNLVFKFIIPVYKASKQMKQKFREMHTQMQDQMNQQQDFTKSQPAQQATAKASKGDYIDFEEVK